MTATASQTNRLTGGRDGKAGPSIYDFKLEDVCPECFTIRAANQSCICEDAE